MTLPPLPDSPYLYTEWSSPAERVSNTMFTEVQIQAYGKQCREEVLEFVMGLIKINQQFQEMLKDFK